MNKHVTYLSIFFFSTLLTVTQYAQAHCDTLDGPVLQDARKALIQQDVTPVLKWIRQQDETVHLAVEGYDGRELLQVLKRGRLQAACCSA